VRARGRRHRAGFTIIELMISLVISSLLVGMILSIFTRMSTAYRTQQHVAELQQVLTAAQGVIQRDVRQAGFQLPDGFRTVGATGVHAAVEISDNASGLGPDELHVFSADPSAVARVVGFNSTDLADPFTQFTVDNQDRFQTNDLVVIANSRPDVTSDGIVTVRFEACVAQLQQVAGPTFIVRTGGSWGDGANAQCNLVRSKHATTTPTTTMVYRFKARGYRIDPARRDLAVLQMSPSGGLLANDWQDLGIGFTDLQVASRWYESEDVTARATTDTPDPDTDPIRDWYSGADQAALSAFTPTVGNAALSGQRPLVMEVRVSLAVRTTSRLDTVGAAATPAFIDPTRVDNNDVGNRAAVPLAGVPDASRPPELRGDALYRYSTVGSDTRNLSVGR